jgi:hypothetical protein
VFKLLQTLVGGNMKKLELSNKYIVCVERNVDNSLTIIATSEKMFQLLLKRLSLFADTVDSGVEKVKRQFTYTSDLKKLSITFEKDTSQAINVLHTDYCISAEEQSRILSYIQSAKKSYKFSSVLDCLKSKRHVNASPDEETRLMPEKK